MNNQSLIINQRYNSTNKFSLVGILIFGIVCINVLVNNDSLRLFKIFEEFDLGVYVGFLSWGGFAFVFHLRPYSLKAICRDKVSLCILLFLLNVVWVNFISGVFIYGQPLLGVVRNLVRWGGLMIYPTLIMMGNKYEFEKKITKFLIILGVAGLVFSMVIKYYDLYDLLINVYERLGDIRSPRLFISVGVFAFFYFIVHCAYQKKSTNALYVLLAVMIYLIMAFAMLSRRHIILIPILLLYYVIRNYSFKHCFKILFFLIPVIALLLLISPVHDFVIEFSSDLWASFTDPSAKSYNSGEVRIDGIKFYWQQFKQTDFLGIGQISTTHGNTNNPIANELSAEYGAMLLVDLGIMGVLFKWGFLGIVIWGASLYICFRRMYYVKAYGVLEQRLLAMTLELCFIFELIRLGPFWMLHTFSFVNFILYMYLITVNYNRLFETCSSEQHSSHFLRSGR